MANQTMTLIRSTDLISQFRILIGIHTGNRSRSGFSLRGHQTYLFVHFPEKFNWRVQLVPKDTALNYSEDSNFPPIPRNEFQGLSLIFDEIKFTNLL